MAIWRPLWQDCRMITAPDQFSRIFAAAFGAQDADAIARLLTPDATVLTLTGQWAEGAGPAQALMAEDFAGTLARARLVTGRFSLTPLRDDIVLLHQRYVVTGAVDGAGADMARIGAILTATLVAAKGEWRAASLIMAPLAV